MQNLSRCTGRNFVTPDIPVPTFDQMIRFFPVSVWALAVFIAGLWLGRQSCREYIDFLRELLKDRRE